MADDTLNDRIAAARMRVDQQFEDRVEASSFSRQQWGLVMTAIDFDIEDADDPEGARLVANTTKLSSVMSQVEDAGNRDRRMGGGGGGSSSGASSSGGIFSAVTDALGFGGGGKSGLQREAEELAQEYAEELQAHLEDRGRWESIRNRAGD